MPLVDANERPVDHCPISLEAMEDPVLVCDGAFFKTPVMCGVLCKGTPQVKNKRVITEHDMICDMIWFDVMVI